MRRRVDLAGHRAGTSPALAPRRNLLWPCRRAPYRACGCGVPVSMWRITRQPRYPLRIGASRVAPAPLANRKIAFGCGRLAIRASAPRSLCCGRVIRHRWHGRDCVAGLRLAPPPRNRLWSRALHPSANAACMAWSGYLPAPCNAASRRLPCAGGGLRSGPARLRPSTCALSVHAISRAAQASPLAPLR